MNIISKFIIKNFNDRRKLIIGILSSKSVPNRKKQH